MNKKLSGPVQQGLKSGKKSYWLKAIGAVAIMGIGLALYRKKSKVVGSALISGSARMLTGLADQ